MADEDNMKSADFEGFVGSLCLEHLFCMFVFQKWN